MGTELVTGLAGGEAPGLLPYQPQGTLGREAWKPGLRPCVPARPPAQQPLPACSAGRGSAVGYQSGYFHNGCLRLGGGGGGRGRGQRSSLSSSLSKLGLAQPEACGPELALQRGSPAHGDRAPTRPLCLPPEGTSRLPSCLPDQVKGASSTLPCLLLPPSWTCRGRVGGQGPPGTAVPGPGSWS